MEKSYESRASLSIYFFQFVQKSWVNNYDSVCYEFFGVFFCEFDLRKFDSRSLHQN